MTLVLKNDADVIEAEEEEFDQQRNECVYKITENGEECITFQ